MCRRPSPVSILVTAVAVAGLALVSACGGSASGAGGSSASAGPAGSTAARSGGGGQGTVSCSGYPPAVVGAALGLTLTLANDYGAGGTNTICQYESKQPPGAVMLRAQTGQDAAGFAKGRASYESHGMRTTEVVGVGDEAFSSSSTAMKHTITTLVARRGSLEITVSSPVGLEREKALLVRLFAGS